jgi:type III secretion protein U
MSDKTEEASPKRLRKAREDGDSGASSFATQALAFVCAVALVPSAVEAAAGAIGADIRSAVRAAAHPGSGVTFDASVLATQVLALTLPAIAAAAIAAAVASVVQSGGTIATGKLTPKLERLDPIAGLKGLFSTTRLFAVTRSFAVAAAVGWLAWRGLRDHAADLARSTGDLGAAARVAGAVAVTLLQQAAAIGLAMGIADIVITRWSWKKKLRMSKDEVKREHKESEGDPTQKAARERAHQEMLASATVANVRSASVVVVNPTHVACALRYDEEGGDQAPVVVASGEGDLAKRIVEAARQLGVPILRDVPLARALVELEVGDAIPEELYEAVAEILREAWEESPPEQASVTP